MLHIAICHGCIVSMSVTFEPINCDRLKPGAVDQLATEVSYDLANGMNHDELTKIQVSMVCYNRY